MLRIQVDNDDPALRAFDSNADVCGCAHSSLVEALSPHTALPRIYMKPRRGAGRGLLWIAALRPSTHRTTVENSGPGIDSRSADNYLGLQSGYSTALAVTEWTALSASKMRGMPRHRHIGAWSSSALAAACTVLRKTPSRRSVH
jgi:hypothetical protein